MKMLARFTTMALAALMTFSALAPVTSAPAAAGHKGAKIAAGIVLGAAALAILSQSARARPNSHEARCYRWYNRCMDGSDWACEKFERHGCDAY